MVKSYLRYELENTFGVVSTGPIASKGNLIVSSALDAVYVWNTRQTKLVDSLLLLDSKIF